MSQTANMSVERGQEDYLPDKGVLAPGSTEQISLQGFHPRLAGGLTKP